MSSNSSGTKHLSEEDEVLLRMLKTPPKHHADMKVGKKKKPSRDESPSEAKLGKIAKAKKKMSGH